MPVRGVIFDLDGTLIDSNAAHARAWVDVLQAAGYNVGYPAVRPLIGMGGDKLIPRLTGLPSDSDQARMLGERRNAWFLLEYAPRLHPFPGIRTLLTELRSRGLTRQIATSAQSQELNTLLAIAGIADLLDETSSKKSEEKSKPDPDIINTAIQQSGYKSTDLVMIGDTPYDVEAATRAGVVSIGFRCGGWPDQALHGAVAVYDGPWSPGLLRDPRLGG